MTMLNPFCLDIASGQGVKGCELVVAGGYLGGLSADLMTVYKADNLPTYRGGKGVFYLGSLDHQ